MFKRGDEVHKLGDKEVGTITEIVDTTAIVKYPGGRKDKIQLGRLAKYEAEKRVTAAQFDEAVKALMYSVAEDVGDTDQLDGVLEIVGMVSRQLKMRLFEGND